MSGLKKRFAWFLFSIEWNRLLPELLGVSMEPGPPKQHEPQKTTAAFARGASEGRVGTHHRA